MTKDQETIEGEIPSRGIETGGYSGIATAAGEGALKGDPPEDDVIELVDVVRVGEAPAHAEEDDLSLILEQDQEEDKEEVESPDFDFETPDAIEPARESVPAISDEDLELVMAGLAEGQAEPDLEDRLSEPATREEPLSISQERLEAAIAGAITPVVERVVREAVAEAAERVIQEAIEGLRKSLESAPE